jgi:hypothetical protein
MSTRTDPRHLIRLRIKVAGTDESGNRFAQTAFTHDVSARGARVMQVPPFLCPATVVDVEYRGKRSRFQVVWVGGLANTEVGLLSLEPSRRIWGTPLPGEVIRSVSMASPPSQRPIPMDIGRTAIAVADEPSRPDFVRPVVQEKTKRAGYYCKDSECRGTHAFHLIADGSVVWDIWPQKIECPTSGRRFEYWKEEIRSPG